MFLSFVVTAIVRVVVVVFARRALRGRTWGGGRRRRRTGVVLISKAHYIAVTLQHGGASGVEGDGR